jgi:hypothetical protein
VTAVEEPTKKRKADLSTLDDQTGDLDSQAPKSVADFERLLLGSPNSSYLWIQFIAFYVGLSQLDQARKTGRRALSAINFREEQEKLNVWVALLNLETSYGDESTLEELFKEAVQSNDAKTVYLRMADIYHRSNKFEVNCLFRIHPLRALADLLSSPTGRGGALQEARQEVWPELKGVDPVWPVLPHPGQAK